MSILAFLTGQSERLKPEWKQVPRIIEDDDTPSLAYAIGDIHGQYDHYCRLEDEIFRDAEKRGQEALIVILGDVIDRGPHSNRVIERLLSPSPSGITRACLSGNHEATMVAFLDRPRFDHLWLDYGGIDTLCSYGLDAHNWARTRPGAKQIGYKIDALVPVEHMRFVAERPYLIRHGGLVFVHAGIDRARSLGEQSAEDLLWKRPKADKHSAAFKKDLATHESIEAERVLVIHGHTPVKEVDISPDRINLDTGAYAGGPLSAARLVEGRLDGLLAIRD